MKSFESKLKVAFVTALALTAATFAFGILAAIAGAQGKCVGRQWVEGYRPLDFFGLSLCAVVACVMIGRLVLRPYLWRGVYMKVDGTPMRVEHVVPLRSVLVFLVMILGVSIFYAHRVLIECLSWS